MDRVSNEEVLERVNEVKPHLRQNYLKEKMPQFWPNHKKLGWRKAMKYCGREHGKEREIERKIMVD